MISVNLPKSVTDKLNDNVHSVDLDQRYREMLDEAYSFKNVGGPFANMLPSSVLEEVDPTAFRCGFSDWADSEDDIVEDSGTYWDQGDVKDAISEVKDDLESELSDANSEHESCENSLTEVQEAISEADEQLKALEKQIEEAESCAGESTDTSLEDLIEQKQALVEKISDLETDEVDQTSALNDAKAKVEELESQISDLDGLL